MDDKFTSRIKAFLECDPKSRNLEEGNMLLLQLTGNRVGYNMIARNPAAFASHLEKQLSKFYEFRIRKVQHAEVLDMMKKAEQIANDNISLAAVADAERAEGKGRGRRPDHDTLPRDIQLLFERNLELIVEIRKLHAQLRELTLTDSPCPDSERYPLLKRMIAADKELHKNYSTYDSYAPGKQG